jgi:hypothetical protein
MLAILFLFLLVIVLIIGCGYLFLMFFYNLHVTIFEEHRRLDFITAEEYDAQILKKAATEYRFPWEGGPEENDEKTNAEFRW